MPPGAPSPSKHLQPNPNSSAPIHAQPSFEVNQLPTDEEGRHSVPLFHIDLSSPICHNFSMSISAMTTKIVAVLGVAALGAFASPALAELICGEAVSDGSYASGGGSWSRIVYEVDTRAWVIEHHLPNGQVVFRGDQYDVTDRSNSGRLQWVGTQYQNRRLHMIGEVMSLTATGEPTYNEWLYDDAKRGALVLHTVALCRFEKPAPPPPTAQPSAPALPPPPPAAEAPPRYLPPTTAKPAPNAAVELGPDIFRQGRTSRQSRCQNWRRICPHADRHGCDRPCHHQFARQHFGSCRRRRVAAERRS